MMATNITYTKTTRGQRASIKGLPDAVGQVLTIMDGHLTEEEILAKLHDVSEIAFRAAMTWLLEGGFVRITDAEPFAFSQPSTVADDAIQVEEISFDEFDALSGPGLSDERKKEIAAESDLAFSIFAQAAAEKKTKLKKKTKVEKEKDRLEAIETTKRIVAAKAEELAKLNAETEVQKQAEVLAKKEVWARLKTEAEDKANTEKKVNEDASANARAQAEIQEKERVEAEAKINAEKQIQLKAKADEDEKLATIDATKEQIKLGRLSKKTQSKNRLKHWFKGLFGLIKALFTVSFVALCIVITAAHFINIPTLANRIEKIASEKIQDQVNIKSAHIWLFPKPHLLLKEITIADTNQIGAEKIHIYPNLTSLKNRFIALLTNAGIVPFEIQSIKIDGLSIAQKDFAHLRTWRKAISSHQKPIVHHLVFEDLALSLNGLSLPTLQIDVLMDSIDAFQKAVISTKEKDFNLTFHAVKDDYLMDIIAADWRLPISPYPVFTTLTATGLIKDDNLTFSSIKGQLYGGKLNAQLETNLASSRLASTGSFKLKGLAIDKLANDLSLNPVVIGALNSSGNFSFTINPSTNAISTPFIDATFSVQKGVVNEIDIAEAMRTKNINGSTNFSTLAGSASLKNKRYQFNNLFLQDKKLQAYGQVTISADQQVSAAISSTINIPQNPITRNLIIRGSINKLKLIN